MSEQSLARAVLAWMDVPLDQDGGTFVELEAMARAALSTPPADDVREALAAARNVEQYLDMLALEADDLVHVVIDNGYDGDGVIQSLEVPDLRTLVAFAREVRPRGTVTDDETRDVPGFEGTRDALDSLTNWGGEHS